MDQSVHGRVETSGYNGVSYSIQLWNLYECIIVFISNKIIVCHYYINVLIYTYCNTHMYCKQSQTAVTVQNISSD